MHLLPNRSNHRTIAEPAEPRGQWDQVFFVSALIEPTAVQLKNI
jgi:hypothetical protein